MLDTIARAVSGRVGSDPGTAGETIAASDSQVADAINRQAVLRQVEGDTEFLREVAQIFSDQSAALIDRIRKALASGDLETVSESAHTLKGSVGSLGGTQAAELARTLERMGRQERPEGLAEMATRLEQEIERVRQALLTFEQEVSGEDDS